MTDVLDRLRAANPVPRDLSTGWGANVELVALAPAPRKPRRWVSVAIAAAVVLGLAVATLVVRSTDESVTPAGTSMVERLARGTWKEIDAGPARGLQGVTTIWTGREIIVWGYRDLNDPAEGAAYNPANGQWRKLAPSPLGVRVGSVVLWLDNVMLVWGGVDPRESRLTPNTDGAAYTPDTDTWRRIAPAPFGLPTTDDGVVTAVWTGTELIVTNPLAPQGPAAAAYRPSQNSWGVLPDSPVSLAGDNELRAVWTGRRIVYLRTSDVSPARALSYDPRTRTWTTLPSAFVGSYRKALVRDRGTAVAIGWIPDATTDGLRWARLDPTRSRWVVEPRMWSHPSLCAMSVTPVGQGAAVLVCDEGNAAGLDMARGTWHSLPAPPTDVSWRMTWTGRGLFTFSNDVSNDELLVLEPARR